MTVKKKRFCSMVVLLAVFLHGCASSPDKALMKKDLESVTQIKIVRYQFAGYMKDTTGSKVAATAAAAPFMLFGAIGGGIGGGLYASVRTRMMTTAGKEMETKYSLPDFTELVHKEFSDKLRNNRSGGPELIVESTAVTEGLQESPSCVLTIRAVAIVGDGTGLQTHTDAQLADPTRNVLWKKRASYKSSDLNRPCKMDELEVDNAKLLHDEIAFAVERTVAELIDHFENKTETKVPEETSPKKAE